MSCHYDEVSRCGLDVGRHTTVTEQDASLIPYHTTLYKL